MNDGKTVYKLTDEEYENFDLVRKSNNKNEFYSLVTKDAQGQKLVTNINLSNIISYGVDGLVCKEVSTIEEEKQLIFNMEILKNAFFRDALPNYGIPQASKVLELIKPKKEKSMAGMVYQVGVDASKCLVNYLRNLNKELNVFYDLFSIEVNYVCHDNAYEIYLIVEARPTYPQGYLKYKYKFLEGS